MRPSRRKRFTVIAPFQVAAEEEEKKRPRTREERHSRERRSIGWPIAGWVELTPCTTSAPSCESILLSDAESTYSIH